MSGSIVTLTEAEKKVIVNGGERLLRRVYTGHIGRELKRARSSRRMLVEEGRYKRMSALYGWKREGATPVAERLEDAIRHLQEAAACLKCVIEEMEK